jgi:hypothetical protein
MTSKAIKKSNVITFMKPVKPRFKDRIFFDKEDVTVGTSLARTSRREPISFWQVTSILSLFRDKKEGQVNFRATDKRKVARKVLSIRHFGDRLTIKNEKTGEMRTLSFAYIVTSAIWRLN